MSKRDELVKRFDRDIIYSVNGGRSAGAPHGLFRSYEEAVGFALKIIDEMYDGVGRYSKIKSTGPYAFGLVVWDNCGVNRDNTTYWVPEQVEISLRALYSVKR